MTIHSPPPGTDQGNARQTLTIPEACAMLGIAKNLGYRLAKAGEFPTPVIKAGRRLMVSRRALDLLLDGRPQQPTGAEK